MEERECHISSGTYVATRSAISLLLSSAAVVSSVCAILLRLFPWISPPPGLVVFSVVLLSLSRLVARRRVASSYFLRLEVMPFSAPCDTPLCQGTPSPIFAARVHTALFTPTKCKPVVHRRAVRGSERLEVVLETMKRFCFYNQCSYRKLLTSQKV